MCSPTCRANAESVKECGASTPQKAFSWLNGHRPYLVTLTALERFAMIHDPQATETICKLMDNTQGR
jgi:hypothetical protein